MQQELALISTHALLALPVSADIVARHTLADAVGIYAFPDDEVECCALVATSGEAAAPLERATVLRGDCWSAIRLAETATARIVVSDARRIPREELPEDFAALHRDAGLRSFVSVAIGPSDGPIGVLVLGKKLPGGFDDQSSLVWVNAAATGLLQHLRSRQVAQAARMLRSIDDAGDPVSAISALLQGGARFMYRATNISMGLRLAVLDAESGPQRCLLFESERASAAAAAASRGDHSASLGKGVVLPLDPMADVTVREVPLANTLLRAAVNQRKARFIKDCVSYVQNCPAPAQDVFTNASEAVLSLVVVPLLVNDVALGALYFTQDVPCDFSNIQDALLGFVHAVLPTLCNKLFERIDALKSMVAEIGRPGLLGSQRDPGQLSPRTNQGGAGSCRAASSTLDDICDAAVAASAAGHSRDMLDLSFQSGSAARLSRVSSARLATEAMLKALQQEVRKGRRHSSMLALLNDLVILEAIGRGGFGSVYRGTWQGAPAAIKVMNAHSKDSEVVSDAMEMAVLSSVQHPNIVQVYCCLTDMVEVQDCGDFSDGAACSQACQSSGLAVRRLSSRIGAVMPSSAGGGAGGGQRWPCYRHALPGEELGAPTCNIIVMEYCDRGTLKEAVHGGMFHRQLDNRAIGVDLMGVVNILLDIAYSVQYIHRMSLLHSDIKLDNILLKTDYSRTTGVVPKLSDFGLAKVLKDSDHVINHSGAGTVTHLAPEMLCAGARITTAVDVYAFGVLMWEMYTGKCPYSGLTRDALMHLVLRCNARPAFPVSTPQWFSGLAAACWSAQPEARPDISSVIVALRCASEELAAGGSGGGGAGCAAAGAAQHARQRLPPPLPHPLTPLPQAHAPVQLAMPLPAPLQLAMPLPAPLQMPMRLPPRTRAQDVMLP